ncbi:DUF4345 domain-containing protein [Sphingomonas baiyangensis]|uniref:DUF4345 domain-containing protein n=1 Tax=Sphingomonas baiyangensis TaxID=2572576 RepID=A0A4U1L166_9SPHN|nr:DUF4345 domain-containing protein [Sphingomonas baiyangensis]TKD50342.1 DUF4345 domain-containing protein [Sphingomonas baiyangensis]
MSPGAERRALQIAIAVTCAVPLSAATLSLIHGPRWLGAPAPVPTDLDSHFRYLSGIFLVMGLAFLGTVPRIETMAPRLALLGAMVITGGIARLASLLVVGAPSTGHLVGLGIELGVVPVILLWQRRVARRCGRI